MPSLNHSHLYENTLNMSNTLTQIILNLPFLFSIAITSSVADNEPLTRRSSGVDTLLLNQFSALLGFPGVFIGDSYSL